MNSSPRTFYILLATQTLSLIGSQMTGIAIGIQVFNETGAVLPFALLKIAYAIPIILAVGFAGVIADRWDRRRVLIIADAGQALASLLLLLSLISGQFQLWHLYAIVFLQSLFAIFQYPAFQASVTMLVPDAHRDRANAIQQITNPAAGIVAPALAGILFSVVGVGGIIFIDLLTFAVGILVIMLIHIPRPPASIEGKARNSFWQEMTMGFRVLWQRRPLFYLIASIMGVNFLWNMYSVLQTPYILSTTHSEAVLGILLSVASAGFLVGGMIMSLVRIRNNRMRIMLPAIAAIGGFMLLFGLMPSPLLMAVMLFLFYMPHPVVNTLLTSILQLKTPPDTQGRVFAAVTQLAVLTAPIALLFSGLLADYVIEPAISSPNWGLFDLLVGHEAGAGMRLIIVVSGALYLLAGLILVRWSRVRQIESELPDFTPTQSIGSDS